MYWFKFWLFFLFYLEHIEQQIKTTLTSIEEDHRSKGKDYYVSLMTFFLLHAQGTPQIMQLTLFVVSVHSRWRRQRRWGITLESWAWETGRMTDWEGRVACGWSKDNDFVLECVRFGVPHVQKAVGAAVPEHEGLAVWREVWRCAQRIEVNQFVLSLYLCGFLELNAAELQGLGGWGGGFELQYPVLCREEAIGFGRRAVSNMGVELSTAQRLEWNWKEWKRQPTPSKSMGLGGKNQGKKVWSIADASMPGSLGEC